MCVYSGHSYLVHLVHLLDLSCLDKKEIEKKVNVQTEESTAIVLNVLPVLPESAEKPPLHSY